MSIQVKIQPSSKVASIRREIPSFQEVTPLLTELNTYLEQHEMQPLTGAIWYGQPGDDKIEAEAIAFINDEIPESNNVCVYEIPEMFTASIVHTGPYNTLGDSYKEITDWLSKNQYEIVGPSRELYHHVKSPVRQDDPSYITEIQFPVEKK
ncbi:MULTISPECIES: GyrI-like domain-containing protein [Bacillus cereus group]|uniref:AraC effector-binding domain-containing protein n=1 Tax=Bacillus cereus TaxID=1396 RepID=A0A9W7QG62_BACCE|nr:MULTISPECIES: GyrI-like domain-containing protein [Bacillus cereus group]KAB2395354.1 hypothetical protein F8172_14870 [Bacillus cereus]KAB2408108.1 hypothetical protein F8170_09870 [Bacillus cereus]KAB2430933.1 hypothetical protein F8168_06430 [Bacillus cereus]OOZ83484.1 hypothetical protein BHL35_00350 [Bacillus cereus]OPD59681.1 hypothetical protein BVG01_06555 [Bacillus anthracis]